MQPTEAGMLRRAASKNNLVPFEEEAQLVINVNFDF